jgi:hypothetical protein
MKTIEDIVKLKLNVYYIGGEKYVISPQVQQCLDIAEYDNKKEIAYLKAELKQMREALRNKKRK